LDILQSIILGIIQGLTEFLPVSSSGHLVIFQKLLGLKEHSLIFDISVHLGTLLSIVTVYFGIIKQIFTDVFTAVVKKDKNYGFSFFLMMIVASIPTAIIGFSLKDVFESLFSSTLAVGIFFIITGIILKFTQRTSDDSVSVSFTDMEGLQKITFRQALTIGVAQGAAIAPGISRSGSTIACGLFVGLNRKTAALFSFLISVPAILGASLLQFKDISAWQEGFAQVLIVGGVSAYLSGLGGLWFVLKFVKKGRLEVFSYYLWALGASLIAYNLI
jgi:undecaprenyl-diphosphatase